MSTPFYTSRLVEFADTDMAGIMHFSAFFRYMESAEHELLRSLGFSVYSEIDGVPISFPRVAAVVRIRFAGPLRRRARHRRDGPPRRQQERHLRLRRSPTQGRDVAPATMTSVCCRVEHGKPPVSIPIPDAVAKELKLLAELA